MTGLAVGRHRIGPLITVRMPTSLSTGMRSAAGPAIISRRSRFAGNNFLAEVERQLAESVDRDCAALPAADRERARLGLR